MSNLKLNILSTVIENREAKVARYTKLGYGASDAPDTAKFLLNKAKAELESAKVQLSKMRPIEAL